VKIMKLIRKHSFLDVRVMQKEAQSLAGMGHRVVLSAPQLDGRFLDVNRKPLPSGAYKGTRFTVGGVEVVPYRARTPYPDKKVDRQRLEALQLVQEPPRYDGLLHLALETEADVYHSHEPETLFDAVMAKLLLGKRGRSVKVVYDAHELEPDTHMLRTLMKEVDHMITVSDAIRNVYAKRYPGLPITVVYNSSRYRESAGDAAAAAPNRPFTLGYEGFVTLAKGDPRRMIRIVDLLKEAGIDARFKVMGMVKLPANTTGAAITKQFKEHPSIDCRWVSYDGLGEQWLDCDAGYIYFELKESNRMLALPNKFFSMLNSGVPVVVNAAASMSAIVEKHECGIVLPKGEASAEAYVREYIRLHGDRGLLARMGRNAREAMRTEYSWQKMEERLQALYASLQP